MTSSQKEHSSACVRAFLWTFFRASTKVYPWETFLGRMKDPLPGVLKYQYQDGNNKYTASYLL